MKWLVFAALVALLFGETTYTIIQQSTNGSGTAWQELPAPPQRPEHIVNVSGEYVVIQTGDNTYYSCSFFATRACWESLSPNQIDVLYHSKPWQPIANLAPPLIASLAEIKYGSSIHAEIGVFAAYAVQTNGTVLAWRYGADSYSSLLFIILPACAGVAGLLGSVSFAFVAWLWPKRNKSPRQPPAHLALNGRNLVRTVADWKWMIFAALVTVCFWETAYIYVLPQTNGSRIPWQTLVAPPKPALRITQLSGSQVIVESTDHTYYACEFVQLKSCWQTVGPDAIGHPPNTTIWQPTSDFAPPDVLWLGAAEAAFVADQSADNEDILAAAAIKNNGDIAVWRTTSNPYRILARQLLPLCAGIVGLLVSIALAAIFRLRPKQLRSFKTLVPPQLSDLGGGSNTE